MEETEERETKMIPLFLSDLDGTLIHEKNAIISLDDVQEIKKWQEQGYLFGLVTGRDRVFCLDLLKRYEIVPDCLITCNGAMTFWKDQRIDASLIDLDVAVDILKELKTYPEIDPFFTAEDGSNYYLNEDFDRIEKEFAHLGRIQKESLMEFLKERKEGLAKISIAVKSFQNVQRLLPEFQREFSNVEVMMTSKDYIEITRKATNKAHAMTKLIEHQNLDSNEIIFIGDGSNDIPLFDMLKYTYVMSNASKKIQKHAKYSINSVADAIRKERENR